MFEDEYSQPELSWSQRAETLRLELIKNYMQKFGKTSIDKQFYFSANLRCRIIDELSKDIVSKIYEGDKRREHNFCDKFFEAASLVDNLCYAANSHEPDADKHKNLHFWSYEVQFLHDLKTKNYKLLQRDEVEGVAEMYLKQSLRSRIFDRTLVEMLIVLEFYHYADEMMHPPQIPFLPVRSPLKQKHPLWLFAKNTAIHTAFFVGIGGAAGIALAYEKIGSWGWWIIGICLLLWMISTVFSVVFLPVQWMKWAKARKNVLNMLEKLATTYSAMGSNRVISANHILDNVKLSAAAGVVWPSPLYVVLEDAIARGGRL